MGVNQADPRPSVLSWHWHHHDLEIQHLHGCHLYGGGPSKLDNLRDCRGLTDKCTILFLL